MGTEFLVWDDKNVLEWMVVMATQTVNVLFANELYT